jgi:hypothetical protein
MQDDGDDAHYYVDFSVSPVIELCPSFLRGSEIAMGRLHVHNGYDGAVPLPPKAELATWQRQL